MFRSVAGRGGRGTGRVLPVEQIHKFTIAPRDLGDGLIARRFFAPQGGERIPEVRAADRKSDKARHGRRDPRASFANFMVVLAATENDAADRIDARPRGQPPRRLAILAPIEPSIFHRSGSTPPILEFLNGFDHQARP